MAELCLVTGGAGFIGSHLVEALVNDEQPVRVFDDLSTGLRDNLSHLRRAPELVVGDLTDADAVHKAMRDVKVVYHLGALASVARSVENPVATHSVCATGTLNILNAARQLGVRRVVYAASSSAYGGLSNPGGQSEDAFLNPLSPYAAAKLAGELYLQAFTATYGLETVAVRFFNIFGPRQRADSPYSGVIALFIAAMTAGKAPVIHGDGLQSRDFTYVTNAVQALRRASQAESASGRVYNVGTGASISVLDLVNSLNDLLGSHLKPTFGPTRIGDVRFSRADIRRAQKELGYQPEVTFVDGLKKTLDWYRQSEQLA
jgi:UDP-glucose 4-epimerase